MDEGTFRSRAMLFKHLVSGDSTIYKLEKHGSFIMKIIPKVNNIDRLDSIRYGYSGSFKVELNEGFRKEFLQEIARTKIVQREEKYIEYIIKFQEEVEMDMLIRNIKKLTGIEIKAGKHIIQTQDGDYGLVVDIDGRLYIAFEDHTRKPLFKLSFKNINDPDYGNVKRICELVNANKFLNPEYSLKDVGKEVWKYEEKEVSFVKLVPIEKQVTIKLSDTLCNKVLTNPKLEEEMVKLIQSAHRSYSFNKCKVYIGMLGELNVSVDGKDLKNV